MIKNNGQGTYTWPDGDKYIGEYKDDKRNGQGTSTSPDGDKHVGECRDDKKTAMAHYIYESGETYVGEYKDNKRTDKASTCGKMAELIFVFILMTKIQIAPGLTYMTLLQI